MFVWQDTHLVFFGGVDYLTYKYTRALGSIRRGKES
jgi:hypothetical protein